nr:MAG TPA: hypothetical protein [Crassvirales sp.]
MFPSQSFPYIDFQVEFCSFKHYHLKDLSKPKLAFELLYSYLELKLLRLS